MTEVFDAYSAYYDLLYKEKDYAGEVEYILSLLANQGVTEGEILELGCGTGKHAEQFAQKGFSVHGVDLSPSMVSEAERRKPVDLSDHLNFEVGDLRTTQIGKIFDVVISLFHVVSYQTTNEDLEEMFATASNHLREGGIFIFDFWYGPAVLSDRPVVRVKRMSNELINVLRIAEPVMDPNENIVEVNYTMIVTDQNESKIAKIEEKHNMRYLFLPELQGFLKNTQMEVIDSHEWNSENSLSFESWIGVICSKKV
jgi:SAM-dependent methyltransferase